MTLNLTPVTINNPNNLNKLARPHNPIAGGERKEGIGSCQRGHSSAHSGCFRIICKVILSVIHW